MEISKILKAPWQWIASPFGYNTLLSVFKVKSPNVDKYKQIIELIRNTPECTVKNNVFISQSHQKKEDIKKIMGITELQDIKQVNFNEPENTFTEWVNNHEAFGVQVENELKNCKPELIFANISTLESEWESCINSGPVMKIYNSFNYTEDNKYEARLLELPLRSDFKLVVIVPNEADVLHNLFGTLNEQGLSAAINRIQPVFTANSELNAPSIAVRSRVRLNVNLPSLPNGSTVQYGGIVVNETGTWVKVLTCIYYPVRLPPTTAANSTKPPFYFAVVFNNQPIFTGEFIPRLPTSNI